MLTLSDWVTWGGTEAGSQLVGQPKRRRKRIAALHAEPGHGPVATIQQTDEGSSSRDSVSSCGNGVNANHKQIAQ